MQKRRLGGLLGSSFTKALGDSLATFGLAWYFPTRPGLLPVCESPCGLQGQLLRTARARPPETRGKRQVTQGISSSIIFNKFMHKAGLNKLWYCHTGRYVKVLLLIQMQLLIMHSFAIMSEYRIISLVAS